MQELPLKFHVFAKSAIHPMPKEPLVSHHHASPLSDVAVQDHDWTKTFPH
jgi:hypothetical protein